MEYFLGLFIHCGLKTELQGELGEFETNDKVESG